MARRAEARMERRRYWRTAAAGLSVALLTTFVSVAPAAGQAGQGMASASVRVSVPPVAQMAVEPLGPSAVRLASRSGTMDGAVRISVRANHGWDVVIAAASGSVAPGSLWVRAAAASGTGEFRRLDPGQEMTVATGGMGATEIRLEYRWSSGEGVEPGSMPANAVPLTYTLASR